MKAQVLLPKVFNFPFTYNSKTESKIGNLVEVPFGLKKEIGVIWKNNYSTPKNRIESLNCCGLEKGVTTSLDKLGYTHDNEGKIIDRERLEKALLSNIEKVLKRVPQEPLDWSI